MHRHHSKYLTEDLSLWEKAIIFKTILPCHEFNQRDKRCFSSSKSAQSSWGHGYSGWLGILKHDENLWDLARLGAEHMLTLCDDVTKTLPCGNAQFASLEVWLTAGGTGTGNVIALRRMCSAPHSVDLKRITKRLSPCEVLHVENLALETFVKSIEFRHFIFVQHEVEDLQENIREEFLTLIF